MGEKAISSSIVSKTRRVPNSDQEVWMENLRFLEEENGVYLFKHFFMSVVKYVEQTAPHLGCQSAGGLQWLGHETYVEVGESKPGSELHNSSNHSLTSPHRKCSI